MFQKCNDFFDPEEIIPAISAFPGLLCNCRQEYAGLIQDVADANRTGIFPWISFVVNVGGNTATNDLCHFSGGICRIVNFQGCSPRCPEGWFGQTHDEQEEMGGME